MYQKITIIGNLGGDPEMKFAANGNPFTKFSVATNESYKDKDGNQVKNTTWWRVVVWGNQAESCNTYLHKGSKVLCEGQMVQDKETGSPRMWQSGSGEWKSSYEMKPMRVVFLDSKNK